MSLRRLECGFIPLIDSAPLVIARELGFAREEGLDLQLQAQPSWSAVRDKLALGRLDAAHLLAPVPIAMSMGLGGMALALDALSVLSMNGNVVGVSSRLARRMADAGAPGDFRSAAEIGRALIRVCDKPLTVGVPFPFSMHAELLYYWLGALGLKAPQDLIVRTVPPPQMAEAIEAGTIEAFCVGEPWGSVAVARGCAELILPGAAIWNFAPEKVLAVRKGWAEREIEATSGLMRAVWRAARWLGDSANVMTAAEIMSGADYLNLSSEMIERTLQGRLLVNASGEERVTPRFIEFFDGAATFPWRSQAVWIATRLARRNGLDLEEAAAVARSCFRPDLYRTCLDSAGADMPGASEKLEGALDMRSPVASSTGEMYLGPDLFFDGRVFDPIVISV